jgi:hypothetical protein
VSAWVRLKLHHTVSFEALSMLHSCNRLHVRVQDVC